MLDILAELHWTDTNPFKTGTQLGARDAATEEAAKSLRHLASNDICNRLPNAINALRDEIISALRRFQWNPALISRRSSWRVVGPKRRLHDDRRVPRRGTRSCTSNSLD